MDNQNLKIQQNIDKFIEDLLHIEDVTKNKLLDIYAGDESKTYLISYDELAQMPSSYTLSQYILSVILKRIGKPGNTVMRKSSALTSEEQIIGKEINAIDWVSANGQRDAKALRNFIDSAYKEISLKGNNPLFLSVGALKWKIAKADEVFSVTTPLLIFPILLQDHLHILIVCQYIGGGIALVRQNEPHHASVFQVHGNGAEVFAPIVIHLGSGFVHEGGGDIPVGGVEHIMGISGLVKLILPLCLEVDGGVQRQSGIRGQIDILSSIFQHAAGIVIEPCADGIVDLLAAQIPLVDGGVVIMGKVVHGFLLIL